MSDLAHRFGKLCRQMFNACINRFAKKWCISPCALACIFLTLAPTVFAQSGAIRIQAEDYSNYSDGSPGNAGGEYRNDDVDIEVTNDVDGAYHVRSMWTNEWLEYTVTLASGTYDIHLRGSAWGDARYTLVLDGQTIGPVSFTTGGWNTWTTHDSGSVTVGAGSYTLRLTVQNAFHFNWIEFVPVAGAGNSAPVAVNDTVSVDQDTVQTIPASELLVNDSDADGDTLSISAVAHAQNGSAFLSGNTITFTPDSGFSGSASFSYTVQDGNGASAAATVNVTVTVASSGGGGASGEAIRLEAEDGHYEQHDRIDSNPVHAYSNGQAVRFTWRNEGFVEWQVNVAQAGTYAFDLAYEVWGDGARIQLWVNGDVQPEMTLDGHNGAVNGADRVFRHHFGEYDLVAGVNTLRLENNGVHAATYDYLELRPVGGTTVPVNTAPVAADDDVSTEQDTAATINTVSLLANDSDADGDTLSISAVAHAQNGSASLTGSTITFTPDSGFSGNASFRYTVQDGNGASDTATVNVTVTAASSGGGGTSGEAIRLEAEDGNYEQHDSIDSNPVHAYSNGQAVRFTWRNEGFVEWQVNVAQAGTYAFDLAYEVWGDGARIQLWVNGDVQPEVTLDGHNGAVNGADRVFRHYFGEYELVAGVNTLRLENNGIHRAAYDYLALSPVGGTTGPVNTAPVANNDTYGLAQNTDLVLVSDDTLLVNDTDVDGDTLLVTAVSAGSANGSVSLSGGIVIYTPASGFVGTDTFTYTIEDASGASSNAVVTISVQAGDSGGSASGEAIRLEAENGHYEQHDSIDSNPAHAYSNGQAVRFTWRNEGFVEWQVNVAQAGTYAFDLAYEVWGDGARIQLWVNGDVQPEMTLDGHNGAVNDADRVFRHHFGEYDLVAGVNTLRLENNGIHGAAYDYLELRPVGGTTGPVNMAPVANNDTYSVAQNTDLVLVSDDTLLVNDTDADGDTLQVTDVSAGSANGSVSLSGETVIYTPASGFVGTDTFTYTIEDASGASSTATVTVVVNEVTVPPQAPVATADTFTANQGSNLSLNVNDLLANDTDPDSGDSLTLVAVNNAVNGQVALDGNTITFIPDAGFAGTASFDYTIEDSNGGLATATVTITVNDTSGPPSSSSCTDYTHTSNWTGDKRDYWNESAGRWEFPASYQVPNGGSYPLFGPFYGTTSDVMSGTGGAYYEFDVMQETGAAMDFGLSVSHYHISGVPYDPYSISAGATLPSGEITTVSLPIPDEAVFDFVTASVTSSSAGDVYISRIAVCAADAGPVNQAPVAIADAFTATQDTSLSLNASDLISNDTDPDSGDSLTLISVDNPVNGQVSLDGNTITFIPDASFTGAANFDYTIEDASGHQATATVTLTVAEPLSDACFPPAETFSYFDDTYWSAHDVYVPLNFDSNNQWWKGAEIGAWEFTIASDGPNAGWQEGFRPTYALITTFIQEPQSASNLIRFIDDAGDEIGSQSYNAIPNQFQVVKVPLYLPGRSNKDIHGIDISFTDNYGSDLHISQIEFVIDESKVFEEKAGPDYFDISDPGGSWDLRTYLPYHNGGPGLNYEYWAWDAHQDFVKAFRPTSVGPNANWSVGYRPEALSLIINQNAPSDLGSINTSVEVIGTSGRIIGALNFNEKPYHGTYSVNIPLNFGTKGDIAEIRITPDSQHPRPSVSHMDIWGITFENDIAPSANCNQGGGGSNPAATSPIANPESFNAYTNAARVIDVAALLSNDTDPNTADVLSVISVDNPVNGQVSLDGNAITFIPDAGFSGTASFDYTIEDSSGNRATATVTLDVTEEPLSDACFPPAETFSYLDGTYWSGNSAWGPMNFDSVNRWWRDDEYYDWEFIVADSGPNVGWQQGFRPTYAVINTFIAEPGTRTHSISIEDDQGELIGFQSYTVVPNQTNVILVPLYLGNTDRDIHKLKILTSSNTADPLHVTKIEFVVDESKVFEDKTGPDYFDVYDPSGSWRNQFVGFFQGFNRQEWVTNQQFDKVFTPNETGPDANWVDGFRPGELKLNISQNVEAIGSDIIVEVRDASGGLIGGGNFDAPEYYSSLLSRYFRYGLGIIEYTVSIPLNFSGRGDIAEIRVKPDSFSSLTNSFRIAQITFESDVELPNGCDTGEPSTGGGVSSPPAGGGDQTPANTSPTANPETYSTYTNTPIVVEVDALLSNDSDPDPDDEISFRTLGTFASLGQAELNGNAITFTPMSDYTGTNAYFRYYIEDLNGGLSQARVSITVEEAPAAGVPDLVYVPESNVDAVNTIDWSEILGIPSHQIEVGSGAIDWLITTTEIDYAMYDIYYGDVDQDGHKDVYFAGRDQLIFLPSGESVTQVQVQIDSFYLRATDSLLDCQTINHTAYYDISCTFDARFESSLTPIDDLSEQEIAARNLQPLHEGTQYHVADLDGDNTKDLVLNLAGFVAASQVNNLEQPLSNYDATLVLNGGHDLPNADWQGAGYISDFESYTVSDADGDGAEELTIPGASSDAYFELDWDGTDFAGGYDYDEVRVKNPTLHGASTGSFRVTENGAASYSIPLTLPVGTAGVAPELSLNYSSQGGDGLLGLGWSLSGQSVITRCRQTLSQDGQAKPITWTGEDRFCLDGQRLIDSGTYQNATHYKTEIDNFARILAFGSDYRPSHFSVEAKDGSISYYGNTNSADQVFPGIHRQYAWAISSFEDSVGNKITYEYDDDDGSDFRITKIEYAYAGGNTPHAQVEFIYTRRPDEIKSYIAGEELFTGKRLSEIVVSSREPSSGSTGMQEIRRYRLIYKALKESNWIQKSYIEAVQECVGDACLPATHFDWQMDGGLDFSQAAPASALDLIQRESRLLQFMPFDMDGDGFLDVAWLENDEHNNGAYDIVLKYARYNPDTMQFSKGEFINADNLYYERFEENGFNSKEQISIQPIDYNGDGRQDIALFRDKNTFNHWEIYLSTPSLEPGGDWLISADEEVVDVGSVYATFIDANSDGLADIITPEKIWTLKRNSEPATSNRPYSYVEEPGTLSWEGLTRPFTSTGSNTSTPIYEKDFVAGGDFDGDGVGDVVLVHRRYWTSSQLGFTHATHIEEHYYAMRRSGNGFESMRYLGRASDPAQIDHEPEKKLAPLARVFALDVNGDTYTDIIFEKTATDGSADYELRLNTGTTFKDPVTVFSVDDYEDYEIQLNDLNADGYADLQYRKKSSGAISYKPWSANTETFLEERPVATVAGAIDSAQDRIMVYDATGDSHLDVVFVDGRFLKVMPNLNSGLTGSVSKITNGLGAVTHINYEKLNQTDNYIGLFETHSYELYQSADVECGLPTPYEDESQIPRSEWFFYGCYEVPATTIDYRSVNEFYRSVNSPFSDVTDTQNVIAGNKYAVLEHLAPMQIVTNIQSSAPAGDANTPGAVNHDALSSINYYYEHARFQAGGRGFLGFKKLSTEDLQTGVITSTTYRQDWPFIGYPAKTEQRAPGNPSSILLSKNSSTYELRGWQSTWADGLKNSDQGTAAYLGSVHPYMAFSEDIMRSVKTDAADATNIVANNADLQKKTISNEYDAYGNLSKATTVTEGQGLSVTQVVESTFPTSATANFHDGRSNSYAALGRLTSTTVTTTRNGEDIERVSNFAYYDSGVHAGLLREETVHGGTVAELKTTYSYDGFGNKTLAEITGDNHQFNVAGTQTSAAEQIRKTESVYDSTGRYVDQTITHLSENGDQFLSSNIAARSKFGTPTSMTSGLHSNVTTVSYDALGREIASTDLTGAGVTTTYKKCSGGNCPGGAVYYVEKTANGGGLAVSYIDVLGRAVREATQQFDGSMSCVDTEFDRLGRSLRTSAPFTCAEGPSYWSENTYDILGRIVESQVPNENGISVHKYHYDAYATTATNPLGQVRTETKNGLGELVEVEDELGGKIVYEYDNHGNLVYMKSYASALDAALSGVPGLVTTQIVYDEFNRKIAMNDPDKGSWQYKYNAFGELVWQRDGKGQVVTQSYDSLGRMQDRIDYRDNQTVENHTRWYYDTATDQGDMADFAKTQITAVLMSDALMSSNDDCSSAASVQCAYPKYDQYGRAYAAVTRTRVGGQLETHINRTEFGDFGRVIKQFDALDGAGADTNATGDIDEADIRGLRIVGNASDNRYGDGSLVSGTENRYNDYGFLEQVNDLQTGDTVFELLSTNARGQATEVRHGNGITSQFTYYAESGQIESQVAQNSQLFKLQDISYAWDKIGNLSRRANDSRVSSDNTATRSLEESFCYDALNRLIHTNANTTSTGGCAGLSASQQDIRYDSRGNIRYKNGVGNYSYGSSASDQPHAVKNIDGHSYVYDDNGNLEYDQNPDGKRRSFNYSTFDKPLSIIKQYDEGGQHLTEFAYGIDRSRYWRKDVDKNGVVTTTRYLGNVEKITKSTEPNKIEWKRYLGKTAIITITTDASGNVLSNGGRKARYVYNDHLGSLDVITDDAGLVVQAMSFNPWGERRNPNTWDEHTIRELINTSVLANIKAETTRGFTGHEMVDEVGIIHMNGRIYDARIARFLQADPLIQAATHTQSLNRYAYTWNNPLNATDPSGYAVQWNEVRGGARQAAAVIITTAAFYACGPQCSGFTWQAFAVGAATSAVSAMINGASGSGVLRAALAGGLTAFIGGGISMEDAWLRVSAMGVTGGVTSVLQGGKFGHGFVSGGVSGYMGGNQWLATKANPTESMLIRMLVAGTVSDATGGKFMNGALTSAFAVTIKKLWNPKINAGPKLKFDFSERESNVSMEEWGPEEDYLRRVKVVLERGLDNIDVKQDVKDFLLQKGLEFIGSRTHEILFEDKSYQVSVLYEKAFGVSFAGGLALAVDKSELMIMVGGEIKAGFLRGYSMQSQATEFYGPIEKMSGFGGVFSVDSPTQSWQLGGVKAVGGLTGGASCSGGSCGLTVGLHTPGSKLIGSAAGISYWRSVYKTEF